MTLGIDTRNVLLVINTSCLLSNSLMYSETRRAFPQISILKCPKSLLTLLTSIYVSILLLVLYLHPTDYPNNAKQRR